MKNDQTLFSNKITWLFALCSLFLILDGGIVEADKGNTDFIYQIEQFIPESNNNGSLSELVTEISHNQYQLDDKSFWDILVVNDEGNEIKNVTDWFDQQVIDEKKMILSLKEDYLNLDELYNKNYLLKAHVSFKETGVRENDLVKNPFLVKQSVNGNEKLSINTVNFTEEVNINNVEKNEKSNPLLDRLDDLQLLNKPINSRTTSRASFTYNEANVRELLEIGNQFKRETNINQLQLMAGDPYGRGNVLRFHPNYKFNYMMYTYSNGLNDISKFVTPDFPGNSGNATNDINNIKPYRGIFPFVSSTSSSYMNTKKNDRSLTDNNGINSTTQEQSLMPPIFFKDSISNIIKGVAYNPSENYLMEITLSLDPYSYAGRVNLKLLNTLDGIRNFSIYETTEWQTNGFFSTKPDLKYGGDSYTPIGYRVLDRNTNLEFTLSYRNKDGSYLGDNQYFYTGPRGSSLYYYTGSRLSSSGVFSSIFPFVNNGVVSDSYTASQHRTGSNIGNTNTTSTGVQTNQKRVGYGESVEYGYTYFFGEERKGLSIENEKSVISIYDDVEEITNGIQITNPNQTISNAEINLLVDGKSPQRVSSNQVIGGSGQITKISYSIDVSEWEPGSYQGRIEIVNGGIKSYGEPIAINILKTYTLDYAMERSIISTSDKQNLFLGNDYFSVVKDSFKVDERYTNNLNKVIISYPSNTELLFWNGEDLSSYVTTKLGQSSVVSKGNYQEVTFSSINQITSEELKLILSSITLKVTTRGEQTKIDNLKIELIAKDNKSKSSSEKLPGSIKINYKDTDKQIIETSDLIYGPDYVFGKYQIGSELPNFKLEVDETDKTKPYYPTIEGFEFVERQPENLVVSAQNQTVTYVYKRNKVNLTINYYQWISGEMSQKTIVENLSTGTRKKQFKESIPVENKSIDKLLDENIQFQAPVAAGYTFNETDFTKVFILIDSQPNKKLELTDKIPIEDFTINYYYEPTVQLKVPTDINFGIKEKKEDIYSIVPSKIESDNSISIIDTNETAFEVPDWTLYASTEGFYNENTGVRLLTDVLLKSPDYSSPKVITNESTSLFENYNDFKKDISLIDKKKEEGLFIRVSKVQDLGKYTGILKYKLQAAP